MTALAIQLFWFAAAAAPGESSASQDTKRGDILRLIELTGDVNIDQARELFESGLDQTGKLPQHVKDKVWQEFRDEFPVDEVRDQIAPIYDELFSETDIKDLLAFYTSPVGQKLVEVKGPLMTRSVLAVQEISFRTVQRVTSKLLYYLQGESLRAQGQLEPAIESFRRVVVLYPEDPDFRESLGQALAEAGRKEAARVELDEAARLRSGGAVDPSVAPFVGLWQFPGKLVWVKVLPDGRVFQCRMAPDDQVFKSEGVLKNGRIEWQELWGVETVTRSGTGITIAKDGGPSNTFEMASGSMVRECAAPF